MSAVSVVEPGAPLSEALAEEQVARHAFATGAPGFVGAAVELLLGRRGLPGPLVTTLAARTPLEHGYLRARSGQLLVVSGPPSPGLDVCVERMARDIAVSTHLLAGAGTAVLHQASATVGPRDDPADELLTGRTAGVRVCLDAGLDGDGTLSLRQRWAAAHAVGPVLAAAFANSPLCAGRPTGWRSNRQALRLRSGSAPLAEPAGDPRAAWAAWVLDAPVTGAGLTARTFRQWTRAAPAARPTAADLRRHLDTLRPPVAAHGHLEIDLADRQPGDGWRVPVAVTAVLIEDDRAVDEVLAATAGLGGSTAGRWATAARHGLGDPALATAARACFLAAYAALARYGARRAVRDAVADFTERYVLRGRCPADDVLDRAATRS